MQNTCTSLVQIASRDIHKYTLLPNGQQFNSSVACVTEQHWSRQMIFD